MNLIIQTIENIYTHHNALLTFNGSPNIDSHIIFCIGDNGELNITYEKYFNDDMIDAFSFDIKEGLAYVSLLVCYSFCDQARIDDDVKLTFYDEKDNSEDPMVAINQLYQQLMQILSSSRSNIELLKKCSSASQFYSFFANRSEYVNNTYELLDIQNIKDLLKKEINNFIQVATRSDVFKDGRDLSGISESSEVDLYDIVDYYKFLTSENYILNPAIGREDEIRKLQIALLTPSKSVIIVGAPGVGKTAIVEGLAYLIITGATPLRNKKILAINTSSIVSGCSLVGELEEKVLMIMNYLLENPDTYLFIDEIHTMIGSGTGVRDNLDLANIIKPYIDRGQIKVIGATTEEEYDKYIKSDAAFARRFLKVTVSEPTEEALYKIISGYIRKLEKITNVSWEFDSDISNKIIWCIIRSTDKDKRCYDDPRYNPDASLAILENAFARARYDERGSVSVEDVSGAISECEFLYKSARTRIAFSLLRECRPIGSTGYSRKRCNEKVIPVNFNTLKA